MSEMFTNVTALMASSTSGQFDANKVKGGDLSSAVAERRDQNKKLSAEAKAEAGDKSGNSLMAGLNGTDEPLSLVAEVIQSFIPDARPNTRLVIEEDGETGRFIYQSFDKETGQLVSQFPPEDLMNFLRVHRDTAGLIVDGEV